MNTSSYKRFTRTIRPLTSLVLAFILSFSPLLPSIRPFTFFGWLISTAAVITWDGGGDNDSWHTPANWSSDQVPTRDDTVLFDDTSAGDVIIDQPVDVGGVELSEAYTGVIRQADDISLRIGEGGWYQAAGTFIGGNAPITITGSLRIIGGQFHATTGTMSIAGNVSILTAHASHEERFYHAGGEIVLDGIEQLIFGSMQVNNLTKHAQVGQTLTFKAGATLTAAGKLTLTGTDEGSLKLRSHTAGSSTYLQPLGGAEFAYLDVRDVAASGEGELICRHCNDAGGASGWSFVESTAGDTQSFDAQLTNILSVTRRTLTGLLPEREQTSPSAPPVGSVARMQHGLGEGNADFAAEQNVAFAVSLLTEEKKVVFTPLNQPVSLPANAPAAAPDTAASAGEPPAPSSLPPSPSPSSAPVSVWSDASNRFSRAAASFVHTVRAATEPALTSEVNIVTAEVLDPGGAVIEALKPEISSKDGQTIVEVAQPEQSFTPGKYVLKVRVQDHGADITATQDFTWGVLAVNFSQSTYTRDEEVVMGLAVLDDGGHTVCDAVVEADIVDPDNRTYLLSTSGGSITVSDECADKSVTDEPDYRATFQPRVDGDYAVIVRATTRNGPRHQQHTVRVTSDEPFVLERKGTHPAPMAATRIYPPEAYTMRLRVTARQAFAGEVRERVPASFIITDSTSAGRLITINDYQEIVWSDIAIEAGQSIELSYVYDAPNVSPEFYVAGPLAVGGWQEPKAWHIAADVISDGMNALDVLGQTDGTPSAPGPLFTTAVANQTPNGFGMDNPGDVALDSVNDKLYVSDIASNRVLVYNLNANDTLVDRAADNVLGQANFYTISAATTQARLNGVNGLAIDTANTRLFVVDSTSDRVVVYNVASITDGENAVNVLGQSTFTGAAAATTQAGLNAPRGVVFDSTNNRLFVVEEISDRVVVYDVAAITDGEDAVNVLGQSTFTGAAAATTQTGLNNPTKSSFDSTNNRLFVADGSSNRVIVYDVTAITDGENAVNVLGQSTFTGAAAAASQTGLNFPTGTAFDSTNNRLFVSDNTNHRVVVYDVAAITDGENAVNVLGQGTFTASAASRSQTRLNAPRIGAFDSVNNRLYVSDGLNDRIMIFDVAAITNGENAVDLLGMSDGVVNAPTPNYTKTSAYDVPNAVGIDHSTISFGGIYLDATNNRLFVADANNDRVLVFNLNASDTLSDRIADNVLGQANFYSAAGATSQSQLRSPRGLTYDSTNNRLFVADNDSNRVVVYNVAAITDGENAVNVLGQSTFTGATAATTQAGLNGPLGVAFDSTNNRLFVADQVSNRVVIYDVAAITDGENAVNVLGQSTFTGAAAATTQAGMNVPRGVAFDSTNNRLFVAEGTSDRVIVYDVAAITDGENAVNVLGQSTFTGAAAATTQAGMNSPRGAAFDSVNNRLYVSQDVANRVTVYDVASITDGEDAVNVLGQTNFTNGGAATSQTGLNGPRGVTFDSTNRYLYVVDVSNHRVIVYDVATSAVTLTQNDWRWYVDSDSENVTDPWGNPNISENTTLTVVPATLDPPESTDELRLRVNVTVGAAALASGIQAFKLQYVAATDCTAASGWADVGAAGGGTIWRYATSSVTDQTTLTALKLATSDILGAYAKANSTRTNPNTVSPTQDMEWDFHIQHNAAASATTYCFRLVKSDGNALDTYNADGYPKLETKPATGDIMRHGNVFVDGTEKGFIFAD